MKRKEFLKSGVIATVATATALTLLPGTVSKAATLPELTYSAHVSNIGWMDAVKAGSSVEDGVFAGTTGKALQAEAFTINFEGPEDVTVKYNVHSSDFGWTGWCSQGEIAGTVGKVKQAEAIKISVEGLDQYGYELKYRAHCKDVGWQEWVTADNSEDLTINYAGTTGEVRRMEALEIVIVKTDEQKEAEALAAAQEQASADLTSYVENSALKNTVPGSDVDYASVEAINTQIANGYGLIYGATSQEAVETALNEAKANIVNATKEYAKHLLDTVYNNGEVYFGLILTEENYNTAKENIENADTIEAAIAGYESVLDERLTVEGYNIYEAQKTAISQLNSYVNKEDYTINAEALTKAIEEGTAAINKATTVKEISAALTEAKAAIDVINSDEEEKAALVKGQEEAAAEFTSYVENSALKNIVLGSDMDYASVPEINSAIVKGYNTIYGATSLKDLVAAKETAKSDVVNATKDYNKFLLDTIYNDGKGYDGKILTDEQYTNTLATMEKATDVETIITSYENAVNSRVELEALQDKASTDFTSYIENSVLKNTVPGSDMDYAAVPEITAVIGETYSKIYNAKTQVELDNVIKEAKADLLETTREYVDYLLETVYNYGFNDYGMFMQKSDYDVAKNAIANATTIDAIISAYNTALDTRVEA